jgi:hypothetical protein
VISAVGDPIAEGWQRPGPQAGDLRPGRANPGKSKTWLRSRA